MKMSRRIVRLLLVTGGLMAASAAVYAQDGDNGRKRADSHKDAPARQEHAAPAQQQHTAPQQSAPPPQVQHTRPAPSPDRPVRQQRPQENNGQAPQERRQD